MTGSIHHDDRPVCSLPEPAGPYPCHPAIAEITMEGEEARDYCDFHAKEMLAPGVHLPIERIQIIDDHGERWLWEMEDGAPNVVRAYGYTSRAFVDYGCCLPGQIDEDKLKEGV